MLNCMLIYTTQLTNICKSREQYQTKRKINCLENYVNQEMTWPQTGLSETQVLVSNHSYESEVLWDTVGSPPGNAVGIDQFGDEALFNSLRPISGYVTGMYKRPTCLVRDSCFHQASKPNCCSSLQGCLPKNYRKYGKSASRCYV